jgi:hypothetical protein
MATMGAGSGRRGLSLAAIVAASAALLACPAVGATYKWVDDQGVVHYTDKIPPEAMTKGATVLDKQGRPVQKIDAAPTPEQRKAMETAAEQKQAVAKEHEQRARKDRALLLSYTNEDEIELAKKRAIATMESQIQSAQTYTADLKKKQDALAKKKAEYNGKPLPVEVERESNNVELELSRQTALIQQKKEEVITVSAKYDTDKQRWRDIKSDPERTAEAMALDQPKTKSTTANK